MGLIYVNPEGPIGNPDPLAAASEIRPDVRPDGHERRGDRRPHRRRPHLRQDARCSRPRACGARPEAAGLVDQGFGWINSYGTGKGRDAITSGLEVTWTATPTQWSNAYFDNLFGYEWELTKSPAGAHQWQPKDGGGANTVPDPESGELNRPPTMLTTDTSCGWTPSTRRSRAGSTSTPTSSPTRSPAPGTS